MIIRWLGAFGKSVSLHSSLSFELSRPASDEVAAEPISKGVSLIKHARIGLVVKNSACIKRYKGDVWSVLDDNGRLVRSRKPVDTHPEAWVNPGYTTIIVKNYGNLKASIRGTLKYYANLHDIPLIHFKSLEEIGTE